MARLFYTLYANLHFRLFVVQLLPIKAIEVTEKPRPTLRYFPSAEGTPVATSCQKLNGELYR